MFDLEEEPILKSQLPEVARGQWVFYASFAYPLDYVSIVT